MSRFLLCAGLLLLAGLTSSPSASAQQSAAPVTRPVVVSPAVGEIIDQQEKATYGLFPYYSANNFVEARFERSLTPDSTVRLRTLLRDGRTVLRPFTAAELVTVRTTIEARQQELSRLSSATGAASLDSVGRKFRVYLRSGTNFDGELTAHRGAQLEFLTADLGVVQVERANIDRLVELTSNVARRPANWMDIGNGNRLFFTPTARNLRRNEGSLQSISLYVLGVNYGITDNFSAGIMFSAIPYLPVSSQFLALTPKFSVPVSDKWHVGAGVFYLRIPNFDAENSGFGVGLGYGLATYGSAENNFTVGLGYGFAGGDVGRTPVLQLGGQTRISRRVSLISENIIAANSRAGMGGLYGAKINWRRTSLGLGAFYYVDFQPSSNYYYSSSRVYSSYIIPLYADFTFRFGQGSR